MKRLLSKLILYSSIPSAVLHLKIANLLMKGGFPSSPRQLLVIVSPSSVIVTSYSSRYSKRVLGLEYLVVSRKLSFITKFRPGLNVDPSHRFNASLYAMPPANFTVQ